LAPPSFYSYTCCPTARLVACLWLHGSPTITKCLDSQHDRQSPTCNSKQSCFSSSAAAANTAACHWVLRPFAPPSRTPLSPHPSFCAEAKRLYGRHVEVARRVCLETPGVTGHTVHPAPTPPTTLIWKGSVSSSGNNQRSSSIEEFLSSHRHRGPQNADTRWTTPFLPKPNGRPKQDLLGEAGRIVCKQRGCTPVPKAGQWPTLPNVWGMGQ
jgi:hypothetical protein